MPAAGRALPRASCAKIYGDFSRPGTSCARGFQSKVKPGHAGFVPGALDSVERAKCAIRSYRRRQVPGAAACIPFQISEISLPGGLGRAPLSVSHPDRMPKTPESKRRRSCKQTFLRTPRAVKSARDLIEGEPVVEGVLLLGDGAGARRVELRTLQVLASEIARYCPREPPKKPWDCHGPNVIGVPVQLGGTAQMIDDLRNREPADCSRIDVRERDQLRYWSEKWSMSEDRLKVAVGDSGPWVSRLARLLGKSRD